MGAMERTTSAKLWSNTSSELPLVHIAHPQFSYLKLNKPLAVTQEGDVEHSFICHVLTEDKLWWSKSCQQMHTFSVCTWYKHVWDWLQFSYCSVLGFSFFNSQLMYFFKIILSILTWKIFCSPRKNCLMVLPWVHTML